MSNFVEIDGVYFNKFKVNALRKYPANQDFTWIHFGGGLDDWFLVTVPIEEVVEKLDGC